MLDFCSENNLIISTKTRLPVDSYTHITTRHDCHFKTWIDHVVTSHDVHQAIDNLNILYDITDEDHIPFQIQVIVDNIPSVTQETNDLAPKINWNMVKNFELLKYQRETNKRLGEITIPVEALNCRNLKCDKPDHKEQITKFYYCIIEALLRAGSFITKHVNNSL